MWRGGEVGLGYPPAADECRGVLAGGGGLERDETVGVAADAAVGVVPVAGVEGAALGRFPEAAPRWLRRDGFGLVRCLGGRFVGEADGDRGVRQVQQVR